MLLLSMITHGTLGSIFFVKNLKFFKLYKKFIISLKLSLTSLLKFSDLIEGENTLPLNSLPFCQIMGFNIKKNLVLIPHNKMGWLKGKIGIS